MEKKFILLKIEFTSTKNIKTILVFQLVIDQYVLAVKTNRTNNFYATTNEYKVINYTRSY